MLAIGRFNRLTVSRKSDLGAYFEGGTFGDILLPKRGVPASCQVGDELDVFVYADSEERLVATQEAPLACEGEFAWLKVAEVNDVGAFLDWGLPKDLLLPYAEQKFKPDEGKRVMVRVYLDNSNRLAATSRIDKFLQEESEGFSIGQTVDLLIADKTELGFKAIVDNAYWGVLYSNELFQSLAKGQRITGYIKRVREDKRLDLTLIKPGYEKISDIAEAIIATLKDHDGYLMLTDKSPPETIRSVFKVSKKSYKQAIGALYKQRRITIEAKGIRLVDD